MPRRLHQERVTLQDIADATGLSVNSVSRALKNKPDISAATCEKVQRLAREMGYVRNSIASSLRSGHTRTVAVILGGMKNPYYALMADELQECAFSLGYSLIILCSRDQPRLELLAAETAVSRQVDGILLYPSKDCAETEALLKANNVPYILMSRYSGEPATDTAVCDEEAGAYEITRHLLAAGHKKIAFLAQYDIVFSTQKRIAGFQRACDDFGIPPSDRFLRVSASPEEMRVQVLDWYRQGVSGLFSFCDMEAWSLITTLQQDKLRVPEDMAIAGFDNIQGQYDFPVPLCSVGFDIRQMATDAFHLLVKRIHQEELPRQSYVYPTRLICRGSCGCARRNAGAAPGRSLFDGKENPKNE